jgi:predicted small secreted protein
MAKINKSAFSAVTMKIMQGPQVTHALREATKEAANKALKLIKQAAHDELDRHPVTIEIQAGASSGNLSDTLGGTNSKGRKGNLFTFLGFSHQAEANIRAMHDLIDQAVVDNRAIRKVKTTKRATTMQAKVNLPSPTAFYNATPNNGWTGSWAKGIEKGFDNVIHYRFAAKGGIPGSRSGKGIQLKNVYNAMANFSTKDYVAGRDGFRYLMYARLRGIRAMPKGGVSNLKALLKAKASAVFARFIGR